MPQDDYFRCRPLAITLRRRSCAGRHRDEARRRNERKAVSVHDQARVGSRNTVCVTCPIGAAHARGEDHTDAPAVEAPRVIQDSELRKAEADKGRRAPTAACVEVGRDLGGEKPTPPPADGAPSGATGARADHGGVGAGPITDDEENEMPKPRDLEHDGRKQSIAEWAREKGISPTAIRLRLGRGWSVADAIETPKGEQPAGAKGTGVKRRGRRPARLNGGPTVKAVREAASVSDPIALLELVGHRVEDLGSTPRGRLVLIVTEEE